MISNLKRPEDIEEQILNLVKGFIDNPNSIILSIQMASDDIANSESLKLALKMDPNLKRTICVLTKLDQFEGNP